MRQHEYSSGGGHVAAKEKWQQLLAALEDFAAIQEEHAECLKVGRLKKIITWYDRRQQAFDRLAQCFENVGNISGELPANESFAAEIMARMQALLLGEQNLAAVAEKRKGKLSQAVNAMRKGRKALRGYSLSPVVGVRPRFLSNKT